MEATTTNAPTAKLARRRKKGRGSIYRRRDGRWCAELPKPGGGRKFIYGATAGEVETKLTAAKATLDAGGNLGDDRLTVAVVLDRFLDERQHRTRPRTIESYRYLADHHIKPHIGSMRARALTADDVQAFINRRVREGLSPSMVHHVLMVLRMAFKLAVMRRAVLVQPTIDVHGPKVERSIPVPLDLADTQKLLGAARSHPLGGVWFLAAGLGLRRGEVLGLRWRDVDLDAGRVTVRHQLVRTDDGLNLAPPKTKRALRTLSLSPATVALLQARKARQAKDRLRAGEVWADSLGLIFTGERGHPIDGGTLAGLHAELCKAAGVRHVRFHDLRHGAATLMLAGGEDPATLSATLGHARVAFTLDTYVHTSQPRIAEATGRLGAILGLG